ncbi:Kelch repeat-containing protein [Neorhodopirellula pilleata]|uniref:N-acetylneuraminate epimerase n=1 Tax=Neorhodopirellula pilleata TaxID=2714738 RepID=A0A5C6ALJ2_9BACT|nr:kelch repeat-containing protein [Neorhodopirellula pilleata]TWT99043.1 N-acetylneuraminate epimerase [Neorhodopirellula pilleata]
MTIRLTLCLFTLMLAYSSLAYAHFPFVATDSSGRAEVWFGDSLTDRTYPMPQSVAGVSLYQVSSDEQRPLTTQPAESDELVGLQTAEPVLPDGEIFGSVVYGLYHGTKLTYHVEHLPSSNAQSWPTKPRDTTTPQTVITRLDDGGVQVLVLRGDQPLSGVNVRSLATPAGSKEQTKTNQTFTTDNNGIVLLKANQIADGLNALQVQFKSDTKGQWQEETYESETEVLTATFYHSVVDDSSPADETVSAEVIPSQYPALPEELTSFGAAVINDAVYVYGGHTGSAHSYSTAEQSNRLWRLQLGDSPNWELLNEDQHLQGLALVAHNGSLIRLGGFTAKNEPDTEHDLWSQDSVVRFDPAKREWNELPALPEPRSSFDAAMVEDTIYVIGGWQMAGEADTVWHSTAWSLNLADTSPTWQALPEPPFQRRALSAATVDGKVYAIGGMQATGGATTQVDVYDPSSRTWTTGPSLPGEPMAGFGTAAFACGDSLIATTMDGKVCRLSGDRQRWSIISELEPSRFFHRMLPLADDRLIVLGGANMEVGKFTDLPIVRLKH